MREKQNRVVVTFYTTAEAMATERLCRQLGISGKLISAPRSLSADCGIAWSSPAGERPRLENALAEGKLSVHGIHELMI